MIEESAIVRNVDPSPISEGVIRLFCHVRIASRLMLCALSACLLTFSNGAIAQQTPALPAGDELVALLKRMQENQDLNEKLARQYACDDRTHTVAFNKRGKKIRDYTRKFEYAVINGLPYIHQVEENGVPLSAKKRASEQKHQDAVQKFRLGIDFIFDLRGGSPDNSFYSALPFCCLVALFENRAIRHEAVNGRDNLVVESIPKANPSAVSANNRTALDWKETTWIDLDDLIPTRYEAELVNDRGFLLKGTTEYREFFRLKPAPDSTGVSSETVWLESYKESHVNLNFSGARQFQTFEDTSYNYRKFRTDVRLLDDSVQEIPPQGTSQKP